MTFKAGASRVNITPPIGVWLTGFGGRRGPSISVHDELYARAVVADAGGEQVALIATDIISPSDEIVAAVRSLVREWTGIRAEHLLFNSTHTHSGPSTYRFNGMGVYDDAYSDILGRQVATAVRLAQERLEPATLSFGTEPVTVAANRRFKRPDGRIAMVPNADGAYDPTVYVARFDLVSGKRIVVFSHAAHPVVLGGDNLHISADYCGYACETVEKVVGDRTLALFLQGCCGDNNAFRDPGTFEQARRVGVTLGAAAGKAAVSAPAVEATRVRGALRQVDLPLQKPPPVADADALVQRMDADLAKARDGGDEVRIRMGQGMRNWAMWVRECAGTPEARRTQPFVLQALRVGDVAFIGTQAETFIDVGRRIRERSPFPRTVALGYTNGCIGYLPTAESYPDGGYEVTEAYKWYGHALMLAPESEKVVVDTGVELLKEIAG